MSLRVFVIGLMPVLCYPQSGPESLRKLPTPFETIRDSKQFNAVRLGPGNAINFRTIPPDFRLAAIAMSPDGRYLATAWDSGRIELWDLPSKQRKSEFKSGIGASRLTFSSASDFLVVTALGGKIAFLALPGGEKLRRWKIRLGKSKNDIQEVVLAPNGEWLAYANGERSKVLDLTASRPRVVADLHDAYSVALSQDGTELWTVNRSEMAAFSTAGWRKLSRWPLKSEPSVFSSQFVIRTGAGRDGRPSVAVPSAKGLVIYRKPEMQGEFVTDRPTVDVEFAKAAGIYLDLSRSVTLINADGKTLCEMASTGAFQRAISEDGQWLAFMHIASVDVWRVDDLLRNCASTQGGL